MAMIFPAATCHRFTPSHHVHMIQWCKSLEGPWRPVELVARGGMTVDVRLDGRRETWRFHDEDYVACDGNDTLVVLSLPGLTRLGSQQIGHEPDVLALDPPRRLLYVASESGILTTINTTTRAGRVTGRDMLGDNAHIVAVDPSTGEAYFPLRTGPRGRPELLIETPTDVQAKS
jgi:hypothetical protein